MPNFIGFYGFRIILFVYNIRDKFCLNRKTSLHLMKKTTSIFEEEEEEEIWRSRILTTNSINEIALYIQNVV